MELTSLTSESLAFISRQRDRLLQACVDAGILINDVQEVATHKHPWGNWKHPVVVYAGSTPVARYWVTFPTAHEEGVVRPKFNIDTSLEISKWLNQPKQPLLNPSESSSTDSDPSSF